MKLALSISPIFALSIVTVALPSKCSEPHALFDKRSIPARFQVTRYEVINGIPSTTVENKNISALYEIPDDLKNRPWWCSEDRTYCDAGLAPTVDEGNAPAQLLEELGDTDCTVEQPQDSNAHGYVTIWKLQLLLRQRVGVISIFEVASMSIAASGVRLAVSIWIQRLNVAPEFDEELNLTAQLFWSLFELTTALLACCLPTLRALIKLPFVCPSSVARFAVYTTSFILAVRLRRLQWTCRSPYHSLN